MIGQGISLLPCRALQGAPEVNRASRALKGASHEVIDNQISSALPWNTSIGLSAAKRISIFSGIQFTYANSKS